GWDARKRAYCLKIQPATGSFARNLIYSTKPIEDCQKEVIKTQTSSKLINGLGKGLKCLTRNPIMIDSSKIQ
ncbi:hypothetical protein, partial [Enterobacter kobei]|uniref:hypothetical protein n=1 Tax=Enterobacter kobei TaxID=208224 RepID=UPI002003FEC0